jgi:antitoxin component of MazEF toxin-antitoxin module
MTFFCPSDRYSDIKKHISISNLQSNSDTKMPIIRKVIRAGPNSFAVTLPKTWLELLERETGKKITEVALEINGKITIMPIIEKRSRISPENQMEKDKNVRM